MKKIAMISSSILIIAVMVLLFSITSFANGVEYVILGGTVIRFQYANGEPMSDAEVHIQNENGEIYAVNYTNEIGEFDYSEFYGKASKIEVVHNDHSCCYVIPDKIPEIIYNDDGEVIETTISAGNGDIFSKKSVIVIFSGVSSMMLLFIWKRKIF